MMVYKNGAGLSEYLQARSGGADKEAAVLRECILHAKEQLEAGCGKIYYISAMSGHDANAGTSEDTPWKTIDAYTQNMAMLSAGDTVLFERGGVYRGNVLLKTGVQYGAYGTGAKPAIYGSMKNYIEKEDWIQTETTNIWECATRFAKDVGVIVFNHGDAVGVRKYDDMSELRQNFDFYHDMATEKLYLFMECNPSDAFEDIEICDNQHILMGAPNTADVTIDNLCIRYGGAHGVAFADGSKNIVITNCELAWIGGSILYDRVRYGNAIEFYQGCSDILVENNWIYQIYDAGITHQGGDMGGFIQENIVVRSNLVEYCVWSLEFWTGNIEKDLWRNILYEDNIIRFSGYGWGIVRTNRDADASVCGWGHSGVFSVENFIIRNNIFDVSKTDLIRQYYDSEINIQYIGNTYYQRAGKAALWTAEEQLYATTQEMLEESIARIDPHPKLVQLIK